MKRLTPIILLFALLSTTASAFDLTALKAVWPIQSGSITTDIYSTNTLTNNNSVTTTTGKVYPTAGSFVRTSSQSLSIADNAALSAGSGKSWTIVSWFKATSLANVNTVFAKDDIGVNREYNCYYYPTPNRFLAEVWTGASGANYMPVQADNFGAPSTGVWYCIIVKFNSVGPQLSIKINDGTANTAVPAGADFDGAAAFRIGSFTGANFADAVIGPVYFFGRVTTNAEDTQLYNGGNGVQYPFGTPLFHYYYRHSAARKPSPTSVLAMRRYSFPETLFALAP